jgi:hypothetical protein
MTRRIVRRTGGVAILAALLLAPTSRAAAQELATTFDQLRFRVGAGDTIYVTDETGREVSASVIEVSTRALVVSISGSRREFTEAQVTRIRQRLPDSLWTGGLIGLGVGAALGGAAAAASEGCSYAGGSECYGPAVSFAAIGMGIGVGIDALIKGRKPIFERPGTTASIRFLLVPHLGPRTKAVRLVLHY